MSERRVAQTMDEAQLLAIANAIAPIIINVVRADLRYRMKTLAAIQKDQDVPTVGIFNMTPPANSTTPPRIPATQIVTQRHGIESVRNYLTGLRNGCLQYCKVRDGSNGEATATIAEQENDEQKKFAIYAKGLDNVIDSLKSVAERETQRFIEDYRPEDIIHRTISEGFLGRGEGQKHVSLSEREKQRIKDYFSAQGLIEEKALEEEQSEEEDEEAESKERESPRRATT